MSFEQQWTEYLIRSGFDHKSGASMWPIVVHSHNYDLGMQPPYLSTFGSKSEIYEMYRWMTLIFQHALKFPTSMEQLIDVLTQGRILGWDVFRRLGQPVKVRAFFIWLRHNKILDIVDKIAPIPASRIWPYENIDVDNWCGSPEL